MNEPSSMNHFQNQFVKNSVKSLPIGSSQWRKLLSMEWMWFFKSSMEFFFSACACRGRIGDGRDSKALSSWNVFFFPQFSFFFLLSCSCFVFIGFLGKLHREARRSRTIGAVTRAADSTAASPFSNAPANGRRPETRKENKKKNAVPPDPATRSVF